MPKHVTAGSIGEYGSARGGERRSGWQTGVCTIQLPSRGVIQGVVMHNLSFSYAMSEGD